MAKQEPQLKAEAGTQPTQQGKLINFSWWMKKQGYAKSTILGRTKLVHLMARRGADLWDPESVKELIAKQETWSEGTKANAVIAYNSFLAMEKLTWNPPRYKRPGRIPFIPLESEIDGFIAACGKILGTFLQGLKETGADPGELWFIRWVDINPTARTLTINHPVKGHNPRVLPISPHFLRRLDLLPKKSERIFGQYISTMYANFRSQRLRITRQQGNPRLKEIVFTTFRHWKATMEYHRTKDILYVMRLLGHKTLKSTMIYIDLEKAIYGSLQSEEFTARVANTLEEAFSLVEAGFDYVTEIDGGKIFRKRK